MSISLEETRKILVNEFNNVIKKHKQDFGNSNDFINVVCGSLMTILVTYVCSLVINEEDQIFVINQLFDWAHLLIDGMKISESTH